MPHQRTQIYAASRVAVFVALTAVGSLTSGTARADGCLPGQVASESTAGHCCWPGQTWSDEYNHCSGPPQCPAGWYASGAECVGTPAAAPNPPPPVAVPPPPPEPRPVDLQPHEPVPYLGGPIPYGSHVETQRRKGLIIAGFVMLGAGYQLAGVETLLFDIGQGQANSIVNASSCLVDVSTGLIPIAGSFIQGVLLATNPACIGATSSDAALLVAGGVVLSGIQAAGLALGIYGITHPDRFLVLDHPAAENGHGGLEIALVPGTAATAQGLCLVARF